MLTTLGAGVASLRALLPDLLFGLFVIYNTLRLATPCGVTKCKPSCWRREATRR
jgi:hypothetical protein